jgi:ribosomal-protein-alanine N-acetyltransferase
MKTDSSTDRQPLFSEHLSPLFSPMAPDDVEAIAELERRCFSAPWSAEAYRRELRQGRHSSYWVVRSGELSLTPNIHIPPILAYGGFWLMDDEAHIMTIATHPDWRRRKLGEWLLLKMIEEAKSADARLVTLEVRVSNAPAIALYTKLGFVEVGCRRRYYSDNDEDALLLTLFRLDDMRVWRGLQKKLERIEMNWKSGENVGD